MLSGRERAGEQEKIIAITRVEVIKGKSTKITSLRKPCRVESAQRDEEGPRTTESCQKDEKGGRLGP